MLAWLLGAALIALPATAADPDRSPLFDTPRVLDGDTMIVSGERVHLFGIDAPALAERCGRTDRRHSCGLEAKAHLEKLIGGNTVS